MKISLILLKSIMIVLSIFLYGNCFPLVTYNSSEAVSESDAIWGQMKPGGELICTRRQFLHDGDHGEVVLNPYWEPQENDSSSNHGRPKVTGHLNPGERLTVHKLQVQRSVTTGWLIVHTTDKTNREISVIVSYDANRGGFDDQIWERRGFRLKD
jgi:hypothetical protein